jgi:seryl-tRNA synthetase
MTYQLPLYAIFLLSCGTTVALFASLRALARVRNLAKADLDWEQVAELTGDVGTCKRQIQKVNNRLNGMEGSSRASQELNELLQQLPPAAAAPVPNGHNGG